MPTCAATAAFLKELVDQKVVSPFAPADVTALQGLGLLQAFSSSELAQVKGEVDDLQKAQMALAQEAAQRSQAATEVGLDTRRSHSILFHLQGVDHQKSTLERLQQEESALRNLDSDLLKRQQDFAQLLAKKSVLDMACPYNNGFVAITTAGRMALRDLNVRLYRVGDQEFSKYWTDAQASDRELWTLSGQSAVVHGPLTVALPGVDPSYLWAIAIGMVKGNVDPAPAVAKFRSAYDQVLSLSSNVENRLLAAEVLSITPHTLEEALPELRSLVTDLKDTSVPEPAALGVASILLLGQRADGTFALSSFENFRTATPSYEAAALLSIDYEPYDAMIAKFGYLKSLFASWGYSASEDTELAAAYLTVSELPADSISSKLAILTRGVAGYLQYPLVAASILASIPVLEANETLSLLEKAYEVLGRYTGPLPQAELICLAVRLVHSVRSVDELDPTAKAPTTPSALSYGNAPLHLWAPVFITHSVYYSTFSGIGGPHPGHVHTWGGGGWGGGGFVG